MNVISKKLTRSLLLSTALLAGTQVQAAERVRNYVRENPKKSLALGIGSAIATDLLSNYGSSTTISENLNATVARMTPALITSLTLSTIADASGMAGKCSKEMVTRISAIACGATVLVSQLSPDNQEKLLILTSVCALGSFAYAKIKNSIHRQQQQADHDAALEEARTEQTAHNATLETAHTQQQAQEEQAERERITALKTAQEHVARWEANIAAWEVSNDKWEVNNAAWSAKNTGLETPLAQRKILIEKFEANFGPQNAQRAYLATRYAALETERAKQAESIVQWEESYTACKRSNTVLEIARTELAKRIITWKVEDFADWANDAALWVNDATREAAQAEPFSWVPQKRDARATQKLRCAVGTLS